MNRSNPWLRTALYGLFAVVFAMAVSWFVWSLMGVPDPPVLSHTGLYLFGMAVLLLLSRYKKIALGLLTLVLFWFLFTWPEDPLGQDLPFLWRFAADIYDAFKWGLTWNIYKGPMPISFSWVLALTSLLFSFFFVYVLAFAPFSLLLLTTPLYFIPDLSDHPRWIVWLFAGLLAILASMYLAQDRKKAHWPNPAVVGGILLAVFLLQQVITPETFFSRDFSQTLNRMYDERTGRVHGSFSLSRTGYVPDSGVLGGPVNPTDNPMLDVTAAPFSYYLRGSVYYEFEGDRWRLPDTSNSRELVYGSPFEADAETAQSLGLTLLENLPYFQQEEMGYWAILEQRPRVQNLRTVFSTGAVFMVKSLEEVGEDESPNEVLRRPEFWQTPEETNRFRFTPEGLVFAEESIEEGVYVDGMVMNAQGLRSHAYPELPVRIEPQYAYRELVQEHDETLYTLVYGQLTQALDERDAAGFATALTAIRDHLQNEYPYTLTPEPVPADTELLPYFLETKEGYCVYYASLATELLRDVGVSARYAEGFVAPQGDGSQAMVTVTGSAGHAWAEVEYETVGWLMYETTPAAQMNYLDGTAEEPTEETTEAVDDMLDPSQRERTEQDPERPETETPDRAEPDEPNPLLEALVEFRRPIGVLAALVAWVIWRKWVFRARHDEDWLEKKFADRPAELVERIWKDVQALAKLENTELPTGTPRDTVMTLAQVYSVKDVALVSKAVVVLERTLYGEQVPEFSELAPLLRFHRTLENRIRAYMPTMEWVVRRWVWTRRNPL